MAEPTALPAHLLQSLVPHGHVDPTVSAIVVYTLGACFLALAVVGLLLRLRYRAVARRAEAEFTPSAPLRPGEVILHGKIEHAAGAPHAVRVEVTQEGSESENSGAWSYTWTEVDRRVLVHPFYLQRASGDRIRVEPDDRVYLVDELDGIVQVNLARRIRVAELTPGEEVYVHGVLDRGLDPEASTGYRGDGRALVLRSPTARPMLLSSQPLGERFLERARMHGGVAAFLLVVFAIGQLALLQYHVRLWAGRTIEATILKRNHYTTTDSDGDTVNHYQLQFTAPRIGYFTDEVNRETFAQLAEGQRVPAHTAPRVFPWSSRARLGSRASLHVVAEVLLFIMLPLCALGYLYHARSSLPWYRRPTVVEGGSGRLAESPTAQESIDAFGKELEAVRAEVKSEHDEAGRS
jgi:hypothetical protein